MIYKIEIKETLSRIIDIEAGSESEAVIKAKTQYREQEFVLDSSDYKETEIYIYND